MKAFKKIILLLGGVLVLTTGCDSFLELDPQEVLPIERALNSPIKVEQAMAFVYSRLQSGNLYGSNLHRFGELMADNVDITQGGLPGDPYVVRNTNIFTQGNRDLWGTCYNVIRSVNNIIKAVDDGTVQGATPAQLNQWKGECLAIRALMHHELVKLFAFPYSFNPTTSLGVVIRTEALTADQAVEPKARATVQETYNQIIADYQAAIPLLPATNNDRGRVTSWAARALLARVYFDQNNFAQALAQVNTVLPAIGDTIVEQNDTAAFRNTGLVAPRGGVIWQLNMNEVPGIGNSTRPGTELSFATGAGSINSLILGLSNDRRNSPSLYETRNMRPYSRKWNLQIAFNIPVIRIHELFLIRAESAYQTGAVGVAQASLDSVRKQYYSGPAPMPATTATGTVLLDAIRAQRRIEFVFENSDRFHELRRTQQNVRGLPYNDRQLLLIIPDNETGANPLIIQN